MDRQEIYQCMEDERAHLTAAGEADERPLGKWLSTISYHEYLAWVALDGNEVNRCLVEIREMTAAAIACMEQYGCPPRQQGSNNHHG